VHALLWASIQPAAHTGASVPTIHLAQVAGEEVAVVAIVFGVIGAIAIPIVRAFARRIEGRNDARPALTADVTERLERIERAVEAVALEVERISEGQRFVTQVMAERAKPPALGAGPQ
jgi:hypothetical protein